MIELLILLALVVWYNCMDIELEDNRRGNR